MSEFLDFSILWSPEGDESLGDAHPIVLEGQRNDERYELTGNESSSVSAFDRLNVVGVLSIDTDAKLVWIVFDKVNWVEATQADEATNNLPESIKTGRDHV